MRSCLGYISLLPNSVRQCSWLEVSDEEVTYRDYPFLFDNGFSPLATALLLVTPLMIIAKGYFKHRASDLYLHLVLSLFELVHRDALFNVAVESLS